MNAPAPEPTTYGQIEGFDHHTFGFSQAFPVPRNYVVIDGMAHFRGPDGHLWFAPDAIGNQIEWGVPHNIAAWDSHNYSRSANDPDYLAIIAEVCKAVDAVAAANQRYSAWNQADRAALALDLHLDL